eukprot:5253071-Amphidinium_carterae.2
MTGCLPNETVDQLHTLTPSILWLLTGNTVSRTQESARVMASSDVLVEGRSFGVDDFLAEFIGGEIGPELGSNMQQALASDAPGVAIVKPHVSDEAMSCIVAGTSAQPGKDVVLGATLDMTKLWIAHEGIVLASDDKVSKVSSFFLKNARKLHASEEMVANTIAVDPNQIEKTLGLLASLLCVLTDNAELSLRLCWPEALPR